MSTNELNLEWSKNYNVLHVVKRKGKCAKKVWERLKYCRKICNGKKLEFYNDLTGERCRLSLEAIEVICDDKSYYDFYLGCHKHLIEKIKGGEKNDKIETIQN